MVYSPTGSSDVILIFGCVTSNFQSATQPFLVSSRKKNGSVADYPTSSFPLYILALYEELIPSSLLN